MKVGHFGPTFIFPVKTVNFFEVKRVAPSSTLRMRKSQKKSARVYAHTHAYTQLRDGGGRSAPPESNRVNLEAGIFLILNQPPPSSSHLTYVCQFLVLK